MWLQFEVVRGPVTLYMYVLASQYAGVEIYDHSIWQVRRGSGMDSTFSPEIADVAFDRLAETRITQKSIDEAKVYLYCRYMDDTLILAGGPRGTLIPVYRMLTDATGGGHCPLEIGMRIRGLLHLLGHEAVKR